ncbi:MAG: tRNA(Ile)-lysidine synthase [Methanoregula sp.]|nr:tRNA(Ile)-lysidine synthase [Methanoregula sp.]
MQCSKCHRDAIVFQSYSGLHLCDQHLIVDVEAKAKKVIRAQGWLRPGDHIAVLLSGDRCSSALLYFLKKLTAQRRDIRVSAITIDDGTSTRGDTSRAKRIADDLDTEFLEVSWSEEFSIGAETFTGKNQDISSLPLLHPSRSILLDRIAQQHGITKIAWGQCLDDAAGVVLESVIRGDVEKLISSNSCQDALLRVCPFISVTAVEVSLYAALCGCGDEQAVKPDQRDGLHKDTIAMLDCFTKNHPATKYALLNLGEELAGCPSGIAGLIRACEWYGEYQRGCCNDGLMQREVKNGAS